LEEGTRGKLPPLSWIAALVIAGAVAGAIAGGLVVLLASGSDNGGASKSAGAARLKPNEDEAIVAATEAALPSVVMVINELAPSPTSPGGVAGGAGFIVDERGFIVTNEHLVHEPGKLIVVLNNGDQRAATVVSSDAPFNDIAVLRIQAGGLKALTLGRSDQVSEGQTVVAIGSPDFDYRNSVTVGTVSGTGRRKELNGSYLDDLVQTDAAINTGNSGGPLIALNGEAIGMVTFRDIGGGDDPLFGVSFAISSDTIRPIAQAIIERGVFPRPYFGIEHQNVDEKLARSANLRTDRGALVRRVFDASPADKAGMRPGDVITRIGRLEVNKNMPYINALAQVHIGERVNVQVLRDGRLMDLTVETTAR
jgi:serine protease Do